MQLHRPAYAQVIHRKHIGPIQSEHEVHLDGPPAKSLDLGPPGHDVFVSPILHRLKIGRCFQHVGRQALQVTVLLATHSQGPMRFCSGVQNRLRCGQPTMKLCQPRPNRGSRTGAQLLPNDRSGQTFKCGSGRSGLRVLQRLRQVGHIRVDRTKMCAGSVPIEQGMRSRGRFR